MLVKCGPASAMPTDEGAASLLPDSTPRNAMVTKAARARNAKAINRKARYSRVSGSRWKNGQRTFAALDALTTESRPNLTRATEPATRPASLVGYV